MTMPRSIERILADAETLAARFEQYEPDKSQEIDPTVLAELRAAAAERSSAERRLLDAVRQAREAGISWATIGTFVGTTGEAARQRYRNLTMR
ncbi:hypothetical protein HJG43_05945 [Kineosporiaceae bacterium SCSIO 59966]|nr:hypothetical protein HJG43_05945 [Kineosporiaceae bacterium SCSIO 59966]